MNSPSPLRKRNSDILWLLRSLPLLLLVCLQLDAASYYVDYVAGSDANAGNATTSAWKHCPGDPAAAGVAGSMTLAPGDTVNFKGGVTYVLTGTTGIALRWNGAASAPITYDGNSAGAWGSGRARFTDNRGGSGLTAFSAASAASWLAFKHLEFAEIGGSATLPPDTGTPAAARFGGGIGFAATATQVTIERCVFRDLGYTFNEKPMSAASLNGVAIALRSIDTVTITECDFACMFAAIDASSATTVNALKIGNSTFHNSVAWPLNFANGLSGVTIYGCTESDNNLCDSAVWTGYGPGPRTWIKTVAAGALLTLKASAAANPVPSFQWQKDGVTIPGATSATLTLPAVATGDAGRYRVTATNANGSALSHETVLSVTGGSTAPEPQPSTPTTGAPVITQQPASQTVAPFSTVTFTVAASGSPTPTIQWYRNGGTFAGWTGTSLTIAGVSANDAGTYSAVATNSAGVATSNAATLTVSTEPVQTPTTPTATAPVITTHPTSQTVAPFATVTFTVAASGSPAPTYQWFRNGVTFAGWTGSSLTIEGVSTNDAGIYSAIATNAGGAATSNAATLSVATEPVQTPTTPTTAAPVITTHPTSQTVAPFATVTFTVAASGSPAPSYQWFRNGVTFAGWTGSSLTIEGVSTNDAGGYSAIATNSAGAATSNTATLTIAAPTTPTTPTTPTAPTPTGTPPTITQQPVNQTATELSSATFTATAAGSPAPTYQWLKNGLPLAGATGSTLTLASLSLSDAATYALVATNTYGSAQSAGATLTVVSAAPAANAPAITLQPLGTSVVSKSAVTFTAAASGTPAPTYQWNKDGAAIAGATSTTLTLNNVNKGSAGAYTLVATNSAGTATSQPALLTVTNTKAATTTLLDDAAPTGGVAQAPISRPARSRLANLSVRATAGSGDESLIVGFVVSGSQEKSLLLRGTGPALSSFGVAGVLRDPTLALYSGARLLAANDDWSASARAADIAPASANVGAFALEADSQDAALLASVAPGAYTGQVTGKADTTGTALIELYDLGAETDARLVNLSVRTRVAPDGEAPAIGFVVNGTAPVRLLLRAVGPALADFGVAGALADPQLEVFAGAARVEQNDNWSGSAELAEAFRSVGAFPLAAADSRDAALVLTLAPGAYSAVVSGKNNTAGTVLVEVYELP